jgi:phosphohistidine phosphatase
VICSPAVRARETAAALTADPQIEKAVSTAAMPQGVLKASGWPGEGGTVIIVGHQPTLGAAAALALTGKASPWNMKKGAIWWLSCDNGVDVEVRAMLAPGIL